ncbi:hypothetical protein RS130_12605 [Paraglaciecola aquimarina]|uniref:Secreted protein n=1 Tax=Paraglaciecola aquimarina TaxID=1235557 RepID=A0ABU3SX95_9ALTE|nr:hypothetical protein [Paraglaciecola aquimarina]MDU0354644.1 hypothetical protein [Paraglaciecola aquimarina]
MKMTKKFNPYLFTLLLVLYSKVTMADPYMIEISQLHFSKFLPTSGSCEMNVETALVTDLLSSQMCIISGEGEVAHYRIIAPSNTIFNIQVNSRAPENGDSLTFTPVGKITSDVDDITIIPSQNHIASSGNLGRINIKFGGQIIISNATFFTPDMTHQIEMEAAITWSEAP